MHSGVATELTDGFALGVSILVALTGQPAKDLKQRCRHMLKFPDRPERWQKPGVPDEAAGEWDGATACSLAEVIVGLNEMWAEDRTPMPEVLERLKAIAAAAGADAAPAGAEAAGAAEERCCIICEAAPRDVRFACGHAIVCAGCLPMVVERHQQCPTCCVAFGAQPVAEQGAHVNAAPTFVLPTGRRE